MAQPDSRSTYGCCAVLQGKNRVPTDRFARLARAAAFILGVTAIIATPRAAAQTCGASIEHAPGAPIPILPGCTLATTSTTPVRYAVSRQYTLPSIAPTDWLTVSPTLGTIQAGSSQHIALILNPAGLPPGDYYANITVTIGDGQRQQNTVHLHVIGAAVTPTLIPRPNINGSIVVIDGIPYSTDQFAIWQPGTQHVISAPSVGSFGRIAITIVLSDGTRGNPVSVTAGTANSANIRFETQLVEPALDAPLHFVPIAGCRAVDTRDAARGSYGAPSMTQSETRIFRLSGVCNLPATALAFSVNLTVIAPGPLSYVTLFPGATARPEVSTLNAREGGIVSNAAIVSADENGDVAVYSTDAADIILDVNGYFAFSDSSGLSFYSAPPCRLVDTRNPANVFGGPNLAAGETRTIPLFHSPCPAYPFFARVLSANVTVVPDATLGYLTIWPTTLNRPDTSTVNSPDGNVKANAAIVPQGPNGGMNVFSTDPTALILDANGYFAPPGGDGALDFHATYPCRAADTRNPDVSLGVGAPSMRAGTVREFPIQKRCPFAPNAKAYVMNITVVPHGPLGYLSAWAGGSPRPSPEVSTLNSDGRIVANMAIVPADTNGTISIFVTDDTDVIIDILGSFTPPGPLPLDRKQPQ